MLQAGVERAAAARGTTRAFLTASKHHSTPNHGIGVTFNMLTFRSAHHFSPRVPGQQHGLGMGGTVVLCRVLSSSGSAASPRRKTKRARSFLGIVQRSGSGAGDNATQRQSLQLLALAPRAQTPATTAAEATANADDSGTVEISPPSGASLRALRAGAACELFPLERIVTAQREWVALASIDMLNPGLASLLFRSDAPGAARSRSPVIDVSRAHAIHGRLLAMLERSEATKSVHSGGVSSLGDAECAALLQLIDEAGSLDVDRESLRSSGLAKTLNKHPLIRAPPDGAVAMAARATAATRTSTCCHSGT